MAETPHTTDEKGLLAIAKEHAQLVNGLKKALIIGQTGFLKAGEILEKIKTKKTYRGEDSSEEWTWAMFCARPDLPIPGSTAASRVRIADTLIQIYRVFRRKLALKNEELAPIGWTKLGMIASVCESASDPSVIEEWLEAAKTLTVTDLALLLKGKGYDPVCQHLNCQQVWICSKCGARFKENPNLKKPWRKPTKARK